MAKMHVVGKTYKDSEMPAFYFIVIPILVFALLIGIPQDSLAPSSIMVIILLGFSYFGWPVWADVTSHNDVIFRTPLRKYKVTPSTLRSVKIGAIRDSRVQMILRTNGSLPINYRIRKYTNAPELALAVLNLIENAPQAKVGDDAIKLLRQVSARANK